MSIELGKAVLDLAIDMVAFSTQLNKAESETKSTTDQIGAHGKRGGNAFKAGMGGVVATVGDVSRLIHEGIGVVTEFANAAEESVSADNNLAAALGAIGDAALRGKDANVAWAQAASMKFAIDDETLINTQAQIAAITQLSGPTLDDATQAVIQWAGQSSKSMDAATEDIIRGLQGNERAFHTYRIEIDNTTGAGGILAQMLDKTREGLDKQEKQADTFKGGMKKIEIAVGNVVEQVGEWLTTNPQVLDFLGKVPGYLDEFGKALDGQNEEFNTFIQGVKDTIEVLQTLFGWIGDVAGALGTIGGNIATFEDKYLGTNFGGNAGDVSNDIAAQYAAAYGGKGSSSAGRGHSRSTPQYVEIVGGNTLEALGLT